MLPAIGGRPMRLAPLALAALLAALALAACTGGGEPPPAPPEAASTPTPTAEAITTPEASPTPAPTAEATATPSTPTPTAEPTATATPEPTAPPPAPTATPDARSGLDLIEPAPGAFVRRTFEDGEDIDWTHGVFAHDVETRRTEGYAVAGLESEEHLYGVHPGGWITTWDGSRPVEWGLLLHVETGQSWRWRIPALSLEAASEEHLLFEERKDRERTSRFIMANRLMEEVARFSIDARGEEPEALFSPDGRAVLLELADKVYLVPVATGHPAVLFDPLLRDDGHETQRLVWLDADSRQRPPFAYPHWWYEGGLGIVVSALYETGADSTMWEHYYFSWEGEALPAPRCPGVPSPDGRYAAVPDGSHYYAKTRAWNSLSIRGRRSPSPTPKPAFRSSGCDRRTRTN